MHVAVAISLSVALAGLVGVGGLLFGLPVAQSIVYGIAALVLVQAAYFVHLMIQAQRTRKPPEKSGS